MMKMNVQETALLLHACEWLRLMTRFETEAIGHFRNVRGLGKSMVVFRFFLKN